MKTSSILLLALTALPLAACGGSGGSGTGGTAPAQPAAAVASCASCHAFEKDGGRRSGPNLFGVVGQKAGARTDFSYSPAMKASGIVWTPEQLDAFLAAPQKTVPGNRMSMSGITDAAKRKAAVDYLATLK